MYLDVVALSHAGPHGHGDGRQPSSKELQQGETETLAMFFGSHAGKAGAAPEAKTAWEGNRNTEKAHNDVLTDD